MLTEHFLSPRDVVTSRTTACSGLWQLHLILSGNTPVCIDAEMKQMLQSIERLTDEGTHHDLRLEAYLTVFEFQH